MKVSNVVMAPARALAVLDGHCSLLLLPAGGTYEGKTPEDLLKLPKAERAKYCSRGQVNDIMWVQEPWMSRAPDDGEWRHQVYRNLPPPGNIEAIPPRYQYPDYCFYEAGFSDEHMAYGEPRWAPAATMPRWASRLYLLIMDVDMVALNDLTTAVTDKLGNPKVAGQTSLEQFRGTLATMFGEAVLESNMPLWLVKFARLDLHYVSRTLDGFPRGVPEKK